MSEALLLRAAELVQRRCEGFDAIIDARSPSEFALDHLPGALNWPTLNDAECAEIGTLHAQQDGFIAARRGAVYAARNIAAHIERFAQDKPRDWRPLLYCWRGGKRSGAPALVLAQIGFRVTRLAGGYKAFRREVAQRLPSLCAAFRYCVLCGPTGSGKSRLLATLAQCGAQTLDLETLARHRGSLLGDFPGEPQPSQKAFETALWHCLSGFDAQKPVFIESESRRLGALQLPSALVETMRASPDCWLLQVPLHERIALLKEEYPLYAAQPLQLLQSLQALLPLHGHEAFRHWRALAERGQSDALAQSLIEQHYDPTYWHGLQRNFPALHQARRVTLASLSAEALERAASEMLSALGAAQPGNDQALKLAQA